MGLEGAFVDGVDEGGAHREPAPHVRLLVIKQGGEGGRAPEPLVDADGAVLEGVGSGDRDALVFEFLEALYHQVEHGPALEVVPAGRHGVADYGAAVGYDEQAVDMYQVEQLCLGERCGDEAVLLLLLAELGDDVTLLQAQDAGYVGCASGSCFHGSSSKLVFRAKTYRLWHLVEQE